MRTWRRMRKRTRTMRKMKRTTVQMQARQARAAGLAAVAGKAPGGGGVGGTELVDGGAVEAADEDADDGVDMMVTGSGVEADGCLEAVQVAPRILIPPGAGAASGAVAVSGMVVGEVSGAAQLNPTARFTTSVLRAVAITRPILKSSSQRTSWTAAPLVHWKLLPRRNRKRSWALMVGRTASCLSTGS